MRALFLCDYVWGIGELMRGLRLSCGLSKEAEVDFFYSGAPHSLTLPESDTLHFHRLPVLDKKVFNDLASSPERQQEVRETALLRRLQFDEAIKGVYDLLIIDSFPFCKLLLEKEVRWLIHTLKKNNSHLRVVSSFKGIAHDSPDQLDAYWKALFEKDETITTHFLKELFDAVLVHSDPQVIALDETFGHELSHLPMIHYTGFVADEWKYSPKTRKKQILITTGSGFDGERLTNAVLTIVDAFPDYHFLFVKGPYASQKTKEAIEAAKRNSHVHDVVFIPCLNDALAESTLAIGMAGSTLINFYQTRTPALVFPSNKALDQAFLARKFNKMGFVKELKQNDLSREGMKEAITMALERPYLPSPFALNLNGVQESVALIKKWA